MSAGWRGKEEYLSETIDEGDEEEDKSPASRQQPAQEAGGKAEPDPVSTLPVLDKKFKLGMPCMTSGEENLATHVDVQGVESHPVVLNDDEMVDRSSTNSKSSTCSRFLQHHDGELGLLQRMMHHSAPSRSGPHDELITCVQDVVRTEVRAIYGKLHVDLADLRTAMVQGAVPQRRGCRAHSGHSSNTSASQAATASHEWINRSMRSYAVSTELAVSQARSTPSSEEKVRRGGGGAGVGGGGGIVHAWNINRVPSTASSTLEVNAKVNNIRKAYRKQHSDIIPRRRPSNDMGSNEEPPGSPISLGAESSSSQPQQVPIQASRGASRTFSSQSNGSIIPVHETGTGQKSIPVYVSNTVSYGLARGDTVDTYRSYQSSQSPHSLQLPPPARRGRRRFSGVMPAIPSMRSSWMSSSGTTTFHESSQQVARGLIRSTAFDYLTLLFILANTALIGINTEYSARNLVETATTPMRIVDVCVSVFFLIELLLRLWAFKCDFFTSDTRAWNLLDLAVVILQVAEEIVTEVLGGMSNIPGALSLIRLLRVFRLVRIVRVLRLLRYFSDLRTIVVSLTSSFKPLLSTMVLLALVVYIVGVYFTQLTLTHRIDNVGAESSRELDEYFGTLSRSVISLFQTVTGGIDWRDVSSPLMRHISPSMGFVFALYIACTSIALMNIVTGVFVEGALQRGREDRTVYMINHLRELFGDLDGERCGAITWSDLEMHLDNPKLIMFFKEIDIDISEAKGLFSLLDRDGSGAIDSDEFLGGCLRLRGPAKSLDLQLVMRELAEQTRCLRRIAESLGVQSIGCTSEGAARAAAAGHEKMLD
mmetsp:Transcript_53000/g.152699  ORF Transcript_53000/g.152699 Transcript_53000/m.152699 type:complete len:820 (+) Transcript_53000:66-2525(+)